MSDLAPPIHPGEFVWHDVLVPLNLDIASAARATGLDEAYLDRLVQAQDSINPEAADALGELAGNGPELWVNLQAAFDASLSASPRPN